MRSYHFVGPTLLLGVLGLPAAAAVTGDSRTPVGDIIRPMFQQIVVASLIIGVLVMGLLIYAVIRFRRRKDGPSEGVQTHGNTRLEIAWTIAPALVLGWILAISYYGLVEIDTIPNDIDFEVEVEAAQWFFTFTYPDGEKVNNGTLRVEEDQKILFTVRSADVGHAFGIQDLDVKIDAWPGKTNQVWMLAREPGEYLIQCYQFCGATHGEMKATIIVFPAGTQPGKPYGWPAVASSPAPAPSAPPAGNTTADEVVQVRLGEFRFNHPNVEPFTFEPGKTIEFQLQNSDQTFHNMFIGKYADAEADRVIVASSTTLSAGASDTFTVTLPAEPGFYDVWCNIPGHAGPGGMKTTLSTGGEAPEESSDAVPLLPAPGALSVALGLLGACAIVAARRRT